MKKFVCLLFVCSVVFIGCENVTDNNKNVEENLSKKLKLIVNENYVQANDEQTILMLFDVTEFMKMSNEEQTNKLLELKATATIYIKDNNTEENIIVNKKQPVSLSKLSDYLNSNFKNMSESYYLNTGFSSEIIENKQKKYKGRFDYLSFKTILYGPEIKRFNSNYAINVGDEFYHIVANTYDDIQFEDLISIK